MSIFGSLMEKKISAMAASFTAYAIHPSLYPGSANQKKTLQLHTRMKRTN